MPTDEIDEGLNTEPAAKAEAKPTTPAATTDWEASYKGLQRKYEKLQKQHETLQEKYDNLNEEHEGAKLNTRNSENSLKGVQDQVALKDAEIQRLQGELASQGKRNERQKLIMAEFPELATFEGEELLPDAKDEEELRAKLEKFRNSMGAAIQGKVSDKMKGAGAKSTTKAPPPDLDIDQVYDRMVQIAGSNDPELQAEYQKLQRQWEASFEQS